MLCIIVMLIVLTAVPCILFLLGGSTDVKDNYMSNTSLLHFINVYLLNK